MNTFFDALRSLTSAGSPKSPKDIEMLSPLALAFVGDALYHLYIRMKLIYHHDGDMKDMHKKSVTYVSAAAQAASIERLMPYLTEEETDIFKRGRNAKVSSAPRKADPGQYHLSTGYETLLGYLLLTGQDERLLTLLKQEDTDDARCNDKS